MSGFLGMEWNCIIIVHVVIIYVKYDYFHKKMISFVKIIRDGDLSD